MPLFGRAIIALSNQAEASALERQLRVAGLRRVRAFSSTEQAWKHLAAAGPKSSYRLLFIDASDPRSEEFLAKLMSDEDLSHVQAVVISDGPRKAVVRLFQMGAIAFLQRPFSEASVAKLLENLSALQSAS